MEMDQAEKISEESVEEELQMSDASDPNGVSSIPLFEPRVGEEYQAELPVLSVNPAVSSAVTEIVSFVFQIGLPVPITWICNTSMDQDIKILNDPSVAANSKYFVGLEGRSKIDMAGYFPVPGLSAEPWDEFEVEAFTLGLYIFGKNLLQVQRFMESKSMGQIQSFYYGKFYKSPRYSKWVDCRKMRNKKCVLGSKIFTGCRLHELSSRLLPLLSEESMKSFKEGRRKLAYRKVSGQHILSRGSHRPQPPCLQDKGMVSNALVEERTSLEEYVASLKSMVGIHALVGAIRIGKGKEDLTTLTTDTSKSGHRLRTRPPDLPSGKACSSLESSDIIKFLTSDFRLSKARANELFWEAVWPRLLARGWHSEQPKDVCSTSKNSLVFLVPGVKKFSRRKLTNRMHYFDSVSDVLSKVASEPQLLDLESDESAQHFNDQREKARPCYLKPQVSVVNQMKFTVVDTSSPSKLRELKSLPVGRLAKSNSSNFSKNLQNGAGNSGPVNHCGQQMEALKTHLAMKQEESWKFSVRECSSSGVDEGESKPLKQAQLLVDLNIPYEPVKSEGMSSEDGSEEVQNGGCRRHSTRNRPLTTKALEALEIGLMGLREGRKRGPSRPVDDKTRPAKQGRSDESGHVAQNNNEAAWPVNC